jgi:hypothetical protein
MVRVSRRAFVAAAAAALIPAVLARRAAAQGLDLDRARAEGLVGERPDGYLAARVSRPGVESLVDRINAERRQRYSQVAASNNVPLSAVERQAGQALIRRLEPGQYYMTSEGQWVQR